MNVGRLASHSTPQWAPPSPSPSTVAGCVEHVADGIEIAGGVVEQREVEELLAVAAEHQVVENLVYRSALRGGQGGHAPLGWRLVVGRIAQRKQLVEVAPQQLDEVARARFFHRTAAGTSGVRTGYRFGQREVGDLRIGPMVGEGMCH